MNRTEIFVLITLVVAAIFCVHIEEPKKPCKPNSQNKTDPDSDNDEAEAQEKHISCNTEAISVQTDESVSGNKHNSKEGQSIQELRNVMNSSNEAIQKVKAINSLEKLVRETCKRNEEMEKLDAWKTLREAALANHDSDVRRDAWNAMIDLKDNSIERIRIYKEIIEFEGNRKVRGSAEIKKWAHQSLKQLGVLYR